MRLTAATAIGGFLGLLGPFGSFALPPAVRMFYWVVRRLADRAR